MADSIIKNMMDCNFLSGLPIPKFRSSEVGRVSQDTMKILNTLKPVTRAFTVREMIRLAIPNFFPEMVNFREDPT